MFIGASLPLKYVHDLGKVIGKLLWISHSRIRRIAEKNIKYCFPELNSQQQIELIHKILNETGKVILETGKIWQKNSKQMLTLVTECENEEIIKQAQSQGRGVILAIPHYGSWELVGLYCAKHYTMTSMYAPLTDSRAEKLVLHARQRTGAKLVPTEINGVRVISKALKQLEVIGMLPDQSPSKNGIFVPFFNNPCYTMTLLPKLAIKNDSVVVYTYAQRLDKGRGFKLIFRSASKDLAKLTLEEATHQMNLDLEALIREKPEQYQWTYKRFRRYPVGCKSIYI